MFEKPLQNLIGIYGGEYTLVTKKYPGFNGSFIFVDFYTYTFPYKTYSVEMKFDLGNANVMEVQCRMQCRRMPANFRIERRSHFQMLFSRTHSGWKIDSADDLLRYTLQNTLDFSGIDQLAKEEAFEPLITGESKDESYMLYMEYSLAFHRKEESLIPVIRFFTTCIDKLALPEAN